MSKKKDTSHGFEEFIDHFNIKPSTTNAKEQKISYGKKRHDIQLKAQNFMELEYKRLSRLSNFLTNKLPGLVKSGQTKKLSLDQVLDTNTVKEKLVSRLVDKNSPMNEQIKRLWKKTFS